MTEVSEEMVEVVARALWVENGGDETYDEALHYAEMAEWSTDGKASKRALEWINASARAALEAVAPLIAAQERERCIRALDEDMGHLIEGQALDGPYALRRAKAAIRASKEG